MENKLLVDKKDFDETVVNVIKDIKWKDVKIFGISKKNIIDVNVVTGTNKKKLGFLNTILKRYNCCIKSRKKNVRDRNNNMRVTCIFRYELMHNGNLFSEQ